MNVSWVRPRLTQQETRHAVLKCKACSALWWPTLPFMIGTHRFVRSFALTVLDMLRFSTIRSVAEYLGVGWDMVKNIHKERLKFRFIRQTSTSNTFTRPFIVSPEASFPRRRESSLNADRAVQISPLRITLLY